MLSSVPRTLSGEGVLNEALTGLDNKTLLKVARSRGVDVTKEAQLKPGMADARIIKKIIDDFSPDELDEVRNVGLETSRFRAVPRDYTTPAAARDAWHVKVLQTFFPEVKIPEASLRRAQSGTIPLSELLNVPSVSKPTVPVEETSLADLLRQSIAAAK